MRNPVAAIWVLGAVVALLAYEFGSTHFLAAVAAFTGQALDQLQRWSFELSRSAGEFVRAAAIGLYVVFVALSLLVLRQGGRAKAALILVSGLFYLLVWSTDFDVSSNRWFAGFVLTGIAALVMTRRLVGPGRRIVP